MIKSMLTTLIALYVIFSLMGYFLAESMIFLPPRPSTYTDNSDIIKIKTPEGNISAIYLPNPNASYTLLISHGNAEDLGYTVPILKLMQQHGFAVFAYDYYGYGTSTNLRPTEVRAYANVMAAYDYLTNVLHIPPQKIIAYGHSLGAAVALDLATKKPVAAVIMESPFISACRVLTYIPLLPFDKFRNIKKIKTLKYPLLIIHGMQDTVVPIWHSKKLYAAAPNPKQYFWVPNANHNDILWVAKDEYWKVIEEFVGKLGN